MSGSRAAVRSTSRRAASVDLHWWDPAIGLRARAPITQRLSAGGFVDIGGLGVGSEFSWEIYAGLDYAITDQVSAVAGFRYLSINYEADRADVELDTYGPVLGATLRFQRHRRPSNAEGATRRRPADADSFDTDHEGAAPRFPRDRRRHLRHLWAGGRARAIGRRRSDRRHCRRDRRRRLRPTPEELAGLVDEYVREEVLYRESLAPGLGRDDAVVRRLMRQKYEFLVQDLGVPDEPGGPSSSPGTRPSASAIARRPASPSRSSGSTPTGAVQRGSRRRNWCWRPVLHFLGISGGGQWGAFGAGVLRAWSASGTRPEFTGVSGISTGALIAPFAYLGPEYDDVLEEVYTAYSTEDPIEETIFSGLISGDALADTSKLEAIIAGKVTPELLAEIAEEHREGRMLLVGTTNLDAGRPATNCTSTAVPPRRSPSSRPRSRSAPPPLPRSAGTSSGTSG